LLDSVAAELRARHYSARTERAYVAWVRRFVLFHGRRHPSELGAREVEQFMNELVARSLSASTHQQALCAIVFLYERVLKCRSPWIERLTRPQRSERLPVVLTRQEAREVLDRMRGVPKLMAALLYGAGLRLLECARLRVKDLDFAANHLVIHDAKGRRDRLTVLPGSLRVALREHLARVSDLHRADIAAGSGYVAMPHALARKYPNANRTWPWQLVFPATRHYRDRPPASYGATTFTKRSFSAPFTKPSRRLASRSRRPVTAFATASRPISSRPATTSALFKNS